jgi:hypothetical protein
MTAIPSDEVRPVAETRAPASATTAPYFDVSVPKFVLMSLGTWGVYQLYWSYRQWQCIRSRGENISPFFRAIFASLMNFALFDHLKRDASKSGVALTFNAGLMGLGYLATHFTWRLPDPWWGVVGILSFLPFLPVLRVVDALNDSVAPDRPRNGVSTLTIIGCAIGWVLFMLTLLVSVLPEP